MQFRLLEDQDRPARAAARLARSMLSDDVTRVELEARRRALEEYKLRCQDLRRENDELKQEKTQRETDALQIISFLRRDAERKDELIESLKSTIGQQREVFTQQRDDERGQQRDRVAEMEEQIAKDEAARQQQIENIERELYELKEFKEQKTALEEKSRQDEAARGQMEQDHRETIEAMERKFFEEKGRLQREYATRGGSARSPPIRTPPACHPPASADPCTRSAAQVQADARRDEEDLAGGGGREARRVDQEDSIREPEDGGGAEAAGNARARRRVESSVGGALAPALRLAPIPCAQVQETDELQKVKRCLEEENKKLRREVQLNEQSVKEYAKQARVVTRRRRTPLSGLARSGGVPRDDGRAASMTSRARLVTGFPPVEGAEGAAREGEVARAIRELERTGVREGEGGADAGAEMHPRSSPNRRGWPMLNACLHGLIRWTRRRSARWSSTRRGCVSW